MRATTTRVLPEPGAASTSAADGSICTALSCAGFSVCKKPSAGSGAAEESEPATAVEDPICELTTDCELELEELLDADRTPARGAEEAGEAEAVESEAG